MRSGRCRTQLHIMSPRRQRTSPSAAVVVRRLSSMWTRPGGLPSLIGAHQVNGELRGLFVVIEPAIDGDFVIDDDGDFDAVAGDRPAQARGRAECPEAEA